MAKCPGITPYFFSILPRYVSAPCCVPKTMTVTTIFSNTSIFVHSEIYNWCTYRLSSAARFCSLTQHYFVAFIQKQQAKNVSTILDKNVQQENPINSPKDPPTEPTKDGKPISGISSMISTIGDRNRKLKTKLDVFLFSYSAL